MKESSKGAISLKIFFRRLLRYIARVLDATWIFFPAILFLFLAIFCFWSAGQGKDIIAAFVKNKASTVSVFNYTRLVFFLAIGFWVYISWYSSRVIAYIKKAGQVGLIQRIAGFEYRAALQQYGSGKDDFEPGEDFLDDMPRIIGNACFLIVELAVLQCPILYAPLPAGWAWAVLFAALFVLHFVNRYISKKLDSRSSTQPGKTDSFRRWFWILLFVFILLVTGTSFMMVGEIVHTFMIYWLFVLLLLFHAVFIFYINLRRNDVEDNGKRYERAELGSLVIKKIMTYFFIPVKEYGYYTWLLRIAVAGIAVYIAAIWSLPVARMVGPFPLIILAFGALLAFGNTVTALSVRHRINIHLLLFLLALLLGQRETHNVRTTSIKDNRYAARPELKDYLKAWLKEKIKDSAVNSFDVYFVMANGGASRSGYWSAAVLGKIEDSSLVYRPGDRFSDHLFCLSGTSGGGVGVATFFSMLRDRELSAKPRYESSAREFLKQDYFSYTFARLLGPDFFNYIIHYPWWNAGPSDRAAALEESFEETASKKTADSLMGVPFDNLFSTFPALKDSEHTRMPLLCINTTRMQDGNPGVVTNLKLDSVFGSRIDVLKYLPAGSDVSITTGSILGARFPYLSPAGRIGNNYYVDGGYFDNSGAGVIQEMIQGILDIGKSNSNLAPLINKLHFKVLHIVNSPVINNPNSIQSVAPIKNDLLAPVLTITGAYDMQTTVNDERLKNFIKNMHTVYPNQADYTRLSLYEDSTEWSQDPLRARFPEKEPSYAMNWFISDTTLNRINERIAKNRCLDSLIKAMK